jgi:ATP-dependent protease Clp ATPase subunit
MVAGPNVCICDQCTDLAADIVKEKREAIRESST